MIFQKTRTSILEIKYREKEQVVAIHLFLGNTPIKAKYIHYSSILSMFLTMIFLFNIIINNINVSSLIIIILFAVFFT